jgi:hypothetical protein
MAAAMTKPTGERSRPQDGAIQRSKIERDEREHLQHYTDGKNQFRPPPSAAR